MRSGGRAGRGARITMAVAVLAATGAWLWFRLLDDRPPMAAPAVSVVDALGSVSAEGFARALTPRPFVFPADHGPHPEFRNEWWYYTGNLRTAEGRRFGYQVTFFRTALAPGMEVRRSAWAAREAWMAHVAVTDVAASRFHARSRFARGALGLAGASASPFRVWLEDWSAEGTDPAAATPPMRLSARDGDLEVALTLVPLKPPVLQGERGLSVKGRTPGQASYYYSLTRLETRGRLRIGASEVDVTGTSWMDREWSTSALDPDQVGWDWFALHLDDGRELMVYRLRRADGSRDPRSAGSLVARDGVSRILSADEVEIAVDGWWTSPRGGHRYPARWRVMVPSADLVLHVSPRLADQEWSDPVRYWEGAVEVEGRAGPGVVRGDGYVELVGYADAGRAALR